MTSSRSQRSAWRDVAFVAAALGASLLAAGALGTSWIAVQILIDVAAVSPIVASLVCGLLVVVGVGVALELRRWRRTTRTRPATTLRNLSEADG